MPGTRQAGPSPAGFPLAGPYLAGLACALLAVALFAGFTLVSRFGLTSTALTLPGLALLRFGVAGILLFPVVLRRGLGHLRGYQAALLALSGGLGFALLAYAGFRLAPASHGAVLLHGTIPLFTFVLAGGPVSAARKGGLALILAGIGAMAWDSLQGATTGQWLGDGALLLAAFSWSAYGLLAQRLKVAPLHAAALVATGSLAGFLPVYAVLPLPDRAAVAWQDVVAQGIFQGLLLGVVSILVYTRAVAILGAHRTALFTAAVPCITTAAALVLLGEHPTRAAWLGVAAVTLGMGVALGGQRPGAAS
ncbi:DMT family transporter [Pseudomonas mangiferae]|uniref:DMT family transporter n=1 Tax=Pseudomonas mangiferae TaxID=2593654 RepID=A0A553H462_9PSED|nr:DMT family transporter [Pseudomonas mangiferae]TRX76535.1 DMT family transporter [Pseudomonas mangiferae]